MKLDSQRTYNYILDIIKQLKKRMDDNLDSLRAEKELKPTLTSQFVEAEQDFYSMKRTYLKWLSQQEVAAQKESGGSKELADIKRNLKMMKKKYREMLSAFGIFLIGLEGFADRYGSDLANTYEFKKLQEAIQKEAA